MKQAQNEYFKKLNENENIINKLDKLFKIRSKYSEKDIEDALDKYGKDDLKIMKYLNTCQYQRLDLNKN